MKDTLYSYLSRTSINPYYIELLQYEINKRIYHYGDNFRYPMVERHFRDVLLEIRSFLYKSVNQKNGSSRKLKILSNAYFSFNNELKRIGFEPFTPWWNLSSKAPYVKGMNFLFRTSQVCQKIKFYPLNEIITQDFFKIIEEYHFKALRMVEKSSVSSLIVCQDLGFHERLYIDIFKSLGRPTFMYTHGGIPVVYNGVDDNRADYLMVWGNAIKERYIDAGIKKDKILVAGHPNYLINNIKKLKFSFEDILVLTKAPQGAPSDSTKVTLFDKGNGIIFLLEIQNVLMQIGVKSARLRLHPSENPKWYRKYLDNDFYKIDQYDLALSLKKATLVIGGTSTVFLESLFYGVNYLVFEPTDSNIDVYGIPIRNPFDGSDPRVPVCKTTADLKHVLDTKECCNPYLLEDYFKTHFDISFLKEIIK